MDVAGLLAESSLRRGGGVSAVTRDQRRAAGPLRHDGRGGEDGDELTVGGVRRRGDGKVGGG